MRPLFLMLLTLIVLLQSVSAASSDISYDHHPVLRLFSHEKPEKEKRQEILENRKAGNDDRSSIHLRIWTGNGSLGQPDLFTFGEITVIDSRRSNLEWWFEFTSDIDAEFLLWQVSERPFSDHQTDHTAPDGLVASGPVVIMKGPGHDNLFDIDFEEFSGRSEEKTPSHRKTWFIRILALDAQGKPTGNPSNTVIAHF